MEKPEPAAPKKSDNIKWGIFYYNKDDKRIFPPKTYGYGWTINFANPVSVGVFIAIFVGINLATFAFIYFLVLKH